MNTVKVFFISAFILFMAIFSCSKEKLNTPPEVRFLQPAGNLLIEKDTVLNFLVEAGDKDGTIKQVAFLVNDYIVQWNHYPPYEYVWYDAKVDNPGVYSIKAIARDDMDATSTAEIRIEIYDFREQLLGDFQFTVVRAHWVIGGEITYDTLNYQGVVRRFEETDNDDNLFVDDDPTENPNQKVTIQFLPDKKITSIIDHEGVLMPKSGYHYTHTGSFIHPDTLVFYVGGLGGLGGGSAYSVTGSRLEE
jgi:hypothetical protein